MPNTDEATIKLRAFSDKVPQNNLTEEQNNALELVKKTAQLEEEKRKSLQYLKAIEQLQESLHQEQAKTVEMAKKIAGLETKVKESAGLEAKVKEFAALEAKVKELTELFGKISSIAAMGKAG